MNLNGIKENKLKITSVTFCLHQFLHKHFTGGQKVLRKHTFKKMGIVEKTGASKIQASNENCSIKFLKF